MSDRWQEQEVVEHDDTEYCVSTVKLAIPHGPDRRHDYETCIFWDAGSYVIDRYETQPKAESGHEDIMTAIENGAFDVQDSQFASISIHE